VPKALRPHRSPLQKRPEEVEREEKLFRDVKLILRNLFEREKITIKQVLDNLYEVGSVNLINQKVPYRVLNRPAKAIARCSKPMVKSVAWYWFVRNCPQLLTNWLHYKVRFDPPKPPSTPTETQVVVVEEVPETVSLERYVTDMKKLQVQVRLLTGALVGTVAILGGTLIWTSRVPQVEPTLTGGSSQSGRPVPVNQKNTSH